MDDTVDPIGPSIVTRGRTSLSRRMKIICVLACSGVALGGVTWAAWPRKPRDLEPTGGGRGWTAGPQMPDPTFKAMPAVAIIPPRVAPPPPDPQAVLSKPADPVSVAAPAIKVMPFWEDQAAGAQLATARVGAGALASRDATSERDPDVATPKSELAQRMQTTAFKDSQPVRHHFAVQYTIKKGTVFQCTPSSPISSELPGPFQCTTDENVWSMDGSVILLPRGTQINGTIEHGLNNGDQRLFMVATDALTPRPDLLAIPLEAPVADELGQTGVPGDINDHLWRKVKAALLVSVIDIASNTATGLAQRGNGNTNINLGGIGGQATNLGQTALGHDINIPSTLYRAQGQPLSIYINKYIDLRNFYSLAPRLSARGPCQRRKSTSTGCCARSRVCSPTRP